MDIPHAARKRHFEEPRRFEQFFIGAPYPLEHVGVDYGQHHQKRYEHRKRRGRKPYERQHDERRHRHRFRHGHIRPYERFRDLVTRRQRGEQNAGRERQPEPRGYPREAEPHAPRETCLRDELEQAACDLKRRGEEYGGIAHKQREYLPDRQKRQSSGYAERDVFYIYFFSLCVFFDIIHNRIRRRGARRPPIWVHSRKARRDTPKALLSSAPRQ